jgi:hypothetical protein
VRAQKKLLGCLGLAAIVLALAAPAGAQAAFGLKSISAQAINADGSVDLQAGSHPFAYRVNVTMNQNSENLPEGVLRDLFVELPTGFSGNPLAAPKCPGATFEGLQSLCPANTQVGFAKVTFGEKPSQESISPVYNLSTPLGTPARLGFSVGGFNSFQEAGLRPSDYGLNVFDLTVPSLKIQSITETIWGVPADSRHDPERRCGDTGNYGCPTDSPRLAFLSLPTSCTGPLKTTVSVDSFEAPGVFDKKTVSSVDDNGIEAGLENCEAPPFEPTITAQPETAAADSPTGLHVNVHVPQSKDPEQLASAHLKDTVVSFPPGVVINPSGGDGLGACALEGPQGINLPKSTDPTVPEPAAVSEAAKCPPSSKVGTVSVKTPALDHPLPGTVYLARQFENPFNSLLALYIGINDPVSGIVIKLAGRVELDPVTGQLTTSFENNPQQPVEDLEVDIFGGPRANLTTPGTCGSYHTNATLVPWTTPEGATVTKSSSFAISAAAAAGPCANSEAEKPNSPAFEAGTATPLAGTYSPFVLKMSRENGSQHFSALNVTMPPGLTGKLAGIPYCSEAQLAQAKARSNPGEGVLEAAQPSCPQASDVGTATVGAGSGSPLYVSGHAYLAGPYKGAPLSLAIITPAIAGPFDLGTVVVRSALFVDENTAQITVKSDPIPTILAGIPLDVRSITVKIDRSNFTLNPTSCEVMAVSGEAISTTGQAAPLKNRFQVGGCRGLNFSPKIAISFKGGTKRAQHPALRTVITRPEGQANFGKVSVALPSTQFIDQNHVGNPCTRPKFAEGNCPRISELGTATAYTPLLDKPLKGKVYFRANGGARTLPDIVIDLNGQVHFVLVGFVDTIHKKGSEQARVRTTFAQNPDAPVSKVILQLFGGKRGTIVNSQNLCKTKVPQTAIVKMTGQNGKTHDSEPKIANSCPKKK